MGDDTRDISDSRGSKRDRHPYADDELANLSIPVDALNIYDEVGLAVAGVNHGDVHLSRLGDYFLHGEREAFAKSELLRVAVTTTDPDAQWDYSCESGRVLRFRRATSGEKLWLFFHDITLEADSRTVMSRAGGMGIGFFQYSVARQRLLVFGEFLDGMLTRREQIELRRSNFRSIIHPRSQAKFDAAFKSVVDKGEPVEICFECSCIKHPSFHMQMQLSPVFSESRRVTKIVGGFRNVTVERQAQGELMRLRNEHLANREARRFMVARIAHEIRTPLTGILGMARFMAQTSGLNSGMAEQLGILQRAAEDAINHIDGLSASAASQQGADVQTPQAVSIREILTETAGLWAAKAQQAGVRLGVKVADNVPSEIMIDPLRLRQCLNNVLSNAVKFTSEGSIRIGCGLSGTPEQRRLIIAVRDTGTGMDAEERANLFQPRQQGNDMIAGTYGGSGLGMSITRGLVSQMRGAVGVESERGKGTTITLSLPLTEVAKLASPTEELVGALIQTAPVYDKPFGDVRVLAVDDNASNLEVVEELLRDQVGVVVKAQHGREAIEKLDAETFDIVLMDIHMPVMDGIEATLAIRSSNKPYSDIPIVAVTADADYQQTRVAVNLGMDAALPKPVRLSKVLETFETLGIGARKRAA